MSRNTLEKLSKLADP